MYYKKTKQCSSGVTLIALIITIIVLMILAGVTITLFMDGGILDKAVEARFLSNFTAMEEKIQLYMAGKEIETAATQEKISRVEKLPVGEPLTAEEKIAIMSEKATLAEEIANKNPGKSIEKVNLYEIQKDKIEENEIKHRYIIDVDTLQLYDYQGENFQKKWWHTIHGGVTGEGENNEKEDMIGGWIRLELFYPDNATEKQWLVKGEGEVREEDWKDYTGAIWIQIDRIQDIYIRYRIGEEEYVIPPSGKVGVIIRPDKYEVSAGSKTKVSIYFEKGLAVKEYKVGEGEWKEYTGQFEVGENTFIQARGKREEPIYDIEGNVIEVRQTWGSDITYIREQGKNHGSWWPSGGGSTGTPGDPNDPIEPGGGTSTPGGGTGTTGGSGGSDGGPWETTTPAAPPGLDPEVIITGPTIRVTGKTVARSIWYEEVEVEIIPKKSARNIYYAIGNGPFQLYKTPIKLKQNTKVRAYYETTDGKISSTSTMIISCIKQAGKPYVRIEAKPYPYPSAANTKKVDISIIFQDADIMEYSTDGVVYQAYTQPFQVTQNGTIYARAMNSDRTLVATDELEITNIGNGPTIVKNIPISITAKPDPQASSHLTNKVEIEIQYDKSAKEKYYSIGENGQQIAYTGKFEVTENTVVYAYAKGDNAIGSTYKIIDNISTGIIAPKIEVYPSNKIQAGGKVEVKITFDRNATIKRYEINGDGLRDYVAPFDVNENAIIRAYSENSLGQTSESTYEIKNILPSPPNVVIDKGDYYLIKLNYPTVAINKEYRYKETGTWKPYKQDGILLVKPQYKDNILDNNGNVKIQIEDENGNLIHFAGDTYLLDVSISQIMEYIGMRWDTAKPGMPSIMLSTYEPTREVMVSIGYESNMAKKRYRIIEPDGSSKGWKDYKEGFTIKRNNTVIEARSVNLSGVWGDIGRKTITNIDEQQPVIKLIADFNKASQEVAVRVEVTDDVKVADIKWQPGVKGENDFAGIGSISNHSIVKITTNGYYTFYAEDGVGNKQVYTVNVANIDLTAPEILITVTPEDTVGIEAKANIEYGDAIKKEYKIGENGTWANYTGEITLSSYTIISKNLVNADKTVTLYARGTDSAGNVTNESKKILNLDLDMPKAPVIFSNYGYPVITEYGVEFDSETTIDFDLTRDADHYYSVDNGATWNRYTGVFDVPGPCTVMAKSVKKGSGLEISSTKTVVIPGNALGPQAYDNNEATYVAVTNSTRKTLKVDKTMYGKKMYVKMLQGWTTDQIIAVKKDGSSANILPQGPNTRVIREAVVTIPENTVDLVFVKGWVWDNEASHEPHIIEVKVANEAEIVIERCYPVLTEYGIESSYNIIRLNYAQTSVQRLYKVNEGDWKPYIGEVRIEIGDTIYSKGIDKDGNETRIISSYTATIPSNALGPQAYDENDESYIAITNSTRKTLKVNETMYGKKMYVKMLQGWTTDQIIAVKKDGSSANILPQGPNTRVIREAIVTIPQDTTELVFVKGWTYDNDANHEPHIIEVKVANEVQIAAESYYPVLTAQGMQPSYNIVQLTYDSTSVQRLYKIGEGSWKNYTGPIRLELGETVYAKGIDKDGNETRVITSYTTTIPANAVAPASYDKNDQTYTVVTNSVRKTLKIDSSMYGKKMYVKIRQGYVADQILAVKKDGTNVNILPQGTTPRVIREAIVTIPQDTTELIFVRGWVWDNDSNNDFYIIEVDVASE